MSAAIASAAALHTPSLRKVRAVLLHRPDRHQHDGAGLRLLAQIGGGQLFPHHGLRHQYVTLRSM
jgi:hypothetical protein